MTGSEAASIKTFDVYEDIQVPENKLYTVPYSFIVKM